MSAVLMLAASCGPTDGNGGQSTASGVWAANAAPVADVEVSRSDKNRNAGGDAVLRVEGADDHRVLLRFGTPSVGSQEIAKATLRLHVVRNGKNWGSGGRTISLHRLTNAAWTELGATWNCALDSNTGNNKANCAGATAWDMNAGPWVAAASASALITNDVAGDLDFDVTADVRGFVDGSLDNNGWILLRNGTPVAGRIDFGSRESADAPELALTFGCTEEGCAPPDDCHLPGVCDPSTGVCTNPVVPDGAPCDGGNLCDGRASCRAGVCTAGAPAVYRASVGTGGVQSDGLAAGVSANGRFVMFVTPDGSLVPDDNNGAMDVFVHDRVTNTTVRASVDDAGHELPFDSRGDSISDDGRFVLFETVDTDTFAPVLRLFDLTTATSRFLAEGWEGKLSADGTVVAFSNATLTGQSVFALDIASSSLQAVSVGVGGVDEDVFSFFPAISADGRFVAFSSFSTNLVANDVNGIDDVFVRDRVLGVTKLASVATDGTQSNGPSGTGVLSSDGNRVAFISYATNLVPGVDASTGQVFVRDFAAGVTLFASPTPNTLANVAPTLSGDGRFVAFDSYVVNDVGAGSVRIMVHDLATGQDAAISPPIPDGVTEWGWDSVSFFSRDGRAVVFTSSRPDVVPDDTNGAPDAFSAPNPFVYGALSCDDGDRRTIDTCEPDVGCVHTPTKPKPPRCDEDDDDHDRGRGNDGDGRGKGR